MFIQLMPRHLLSVAAILLLGVACVDSPTGASAPDATTSDPLALTFDQLAGQAATSGDVARAEGFTFAAIAVRFGVTPTLVNVRVNQVTEVYEAFVNSVNWNLGAQVVSRLPAHRTITAWRRTSDGVTRILSLTTPSDSAPVLHPLSLGPGVAAPFAGASALYQETSRTSFGTSTANAPLVDEFWIATLGYVKVREGVLGNACPVDPARSGLRGVTCRQGRYTVGFDVQVQRLASRPYGLAPTSVARRYTSAEQQVAGYRLTFSCNTVSASRGCG